ncbi:GTPase [Mycena floridula]|nr:GTPase [Mycena floridula]
MSRTVSRLPSFLRWISTSCVRQQAPLSVPPTVEELDSVEYFRKRKTEWKRRQDGGHFVDFVIVNIKGGKGGNGCAAFHREKFVPFGPPSGGNGGRGGDVYLLPSPDLTSLASVLRIIVGQAGSHGQGTWQHGRSGEPTIIRVPVGTVVRQLPREDPRRIKDEWEVEAETLVGLDEEERRIKLRERRWVHYPAMAEENAKKNTYRDAERALLKQEAHRRYLWRQKEKDDPLVLDLDRQELPPDSTNSPLGVRRSEYMGHLVAAGGLGGLGNPHFHSEQSRSPKFATAGQEGERITLSLELKLLADIGFVGMPNAGKSTLLRALTGGRAKTEVASYPFTTLNPVVGVVRVAEDGTFEGSISTHKVYDETILEESREREQMQLGEYAYSLTRNQIEADGRPSEQLRSGHHFDIVEAFRFTIADNPGLISGSSENLGLGHSFLRAMERSLALVYVVDLSAPAPWDELQVLREELEQYQPGLSSKARMVIANKADLLAEDGDSVAVAQAKEKLERLETFVRERISGATDLEPLDVIPVSAKYNQNLPKIVAAMRRHIETARTVAATVHEADLEPS